jgi:hypothetical protein
MAKFDEEIDIMIVYEAITQLQKFALLLMMDI